MLFFGRRKREEEFQRKEAIIEALHRETLNKIEHTHDQTREVSKKLQDDGGAAMLVFLAANPSGRKK